MNRQRASAPAACRLGMQLERSLKPVRSWREVAKILGMSTEGARQLGRVALGRFAGRLKEILRQEAIRNTHL